MFKLSRLADLRITDSDRKKRSVPEYKSDLIYHSPTEITATVKFHNSVKWRVIDELGKQDFNDEGEYITVTMTWSDTESFYRHISTFGDNAEIIEPKEYREEFKRVIKNIYNKYKE